MKRRLAIFVRVLIIVLVILGFFLFYSGQTPVMATEELVTIAVLCVSLSLCIILLDKKAKQWERALLFVGMIIASFVFYFGASFEGMDSQWWQNAGNSTVAKNESVAAEYLLLIAVVLACAVILVILVQFVDDVVLEKDGPFPANRIEQRTPMSLKLTVSLKDRNL
jgi:hypothetical protein